jgi:CheY-like chemotaxis protein
MLHGEGGNLINNKFRSFVTKETRMEFDIFLERLFSLKISDSCKVRLESANTSHYVFLTGVIAENENFCHISLVDITEQNLIEKALQNSEERHRDLLYNLDVGILVYNIETKMIISNSKASFLLGISNEEMKFKGKIELKINEQKKGENFSTLHFLVKYTGIGIHKQNQKKIFESFMQEEVSTSKKFGGTGLGLSISNQLLGLMRGKLFLKSELGKGSEFCFSIQFRTSIHEKNTKKINNLLLSKPKEVESLFEENVKILIAEDNEINLLLAKKLLIKMFPKALIFEARNGKQAVAIYKKIPFDIILMDIQMPKKNGYEVTSEIRKIEQSKRTAIIALTAGILKEEKQKCLDSGMDDYISKPINPIELQQTVVKWINQKKQII